VLQSVFVKSNSAALCCTILDAISSVYHSDNANYFILAGQHTLSQFAEKIHLKPQAIQVWLCEVARISSSSSSLAWQLYVGPGLPQKLLPVKVSGYCFFRFHNKSVVQGEFVSPTPGYSGGRIFSVRVVSFSSLVPILKRQNLAFCPCMTYPYKRCLGAMT
jgi:hypothetical protein